MANSQPKDQVASTLDLVDYRQVAKMTGHNREHLRVLKGRGLMPETAHPAFPLWERSAIQEWIATARVATPQKKETKP